MTEATLHRLVVRQVKKFFGSIENVPEELQPFISAIAQSYTHYESDRILIERSMELSSKELTASNKKLVKESKRQQILISSLKESIKSLSDDDKEIIDDDLLKVADILQEAIEEQRRIETELVKAREQAEASLRSKEIFLANISHEIRTPMNAILGMTRLINETQLDDTQVEYVDAIDTSAQGLMVIINDVLDMSKIKSGKFTVEKINFSLTKVIHSVQRNLEFKAQEKGIELVVEIDESIFPFRIGDPTRLGQVLTNLVSNAVKFTEEGSVKIKVESNNDKPEILLFSVQDSGIGIDAKKIKSIFESFTQEDETITRKFGGTGLGLAISKQLVELFGGELEVVSKRGEGSTFSFSATLPEGKEFAIHQIDEIGEKDLSGCKILLVEDNEINRFLAITILKQWGADVDTASNGLFAIEAVRNMEYDVVLMDMQMPEMDGIQATREMREQMQLSMPIIALTANAIKGEREKCISAGMNEYISKPFEPDQLYLMIHTLWSKPGKQKRTAERYSLSKLVSMYNGDMSNVQRTVNIFLNQFSADIEEMQDHLVNKKFDRVKALAHKIKPNIDLFQISELHEPIREIEGLLKAEEHGSLKTKLADLQDVTQEICDSLRASVSV